MIRIVQLGPISPTRPIRPVQWRQLSLPLIYQENSYVFPGKR